MIYDCFLFNGEKECLDIRTEELKYLDVTHVAVQSDVTFTGNKKKVYDIFYFRMEEIIVNDMPNNCDAWAREAHQRNAIMRGLKEAKDDDIVIIGDVDEITKATAVQEFIDKKYDFAALKMDVFWYKFNCLAEIQTWVHPKIMKYSYLKDKMPNDVRGSGFENVIANAGWHFSYLGGENFIANKLQSFSHTEYNKPEYNNIEHIKFCIKNGIALWGGGKFQFMKLAGRFPEYLVKNKEKYKHLIYETDYWWSLD